MSSREGTDDLNGRMMAMVMTPPAKIERIPNLRVSQFQGLGVEPLFRPPPLSHTRTLSWIHWQAAYGAHSVLHSACFFIKGDVATDNHLLCRLIFLTKNEANVNFNGNCWAPPPKRVASNLSGLLVILRGRRWLPMKPSLSKFEKGMKSGVGDDSDWRAVAAVEASPIEKVNATLILISNR
ncbi:hypothetical protein CRG98_044442 [Punica granatum]|uniref:Uncharacterized protein n=1 Tax=Punica granatum TaxID=22663 RepID=A0A2I0HTX5_PUNGR|nr:hypothetical protein CRG98_044442 [Punica granatum]